MVLRVEVISPSATRPNLERQRETSRPRQAGRGRHTEKETTREYYTYTMDDSKIVLQERQAKRETKVLWMERVALCSSATLCQRNIEKQAHRNGHTEKRKGDKKGVAATKDSVERSRESA